MSPSLKQLSTFADVTIVLGPLALVIGCLLAPTGGLLSVVGIAGGVAGAILFLGGLVSRAVELGVRSIEESAQARSAPAPGDDPAADPTP